MRLSLSVVASLAVSVLAQTYTDCNPLHETCPADKALGTSKSFDFTQGASDDFPPSFKPHRITYSDMGASLAVVEQGDNPTIQSDFYIMFGRVEAVIQAAPGQGIISSVVLQSDDLDEIDLEWIGGDANNVQSNFYIKGSTETYDRGAIHPVSNANAEFHTYTVEWTKDELTWFIDGQAVRTVPSSFEQGYPQSPMNIRIGVWAGGDPTNNAGVIEWAGGETDYSKSPYPMYVKSVNVQDYSTGSEYSYSDHSGTWESIVAKDGEVNANAPVEEVEVTSTPVSSAPETSAPATSAPESSSPVTSAESSPVTSAESSAESSAPVSSAESSAPVTSPITSSPAFVNSTISAGPSSGAVVTVEATEHVESTLTKTVTHCEDNKCVSKPQPTVTVTKHCSLDKCVSKTIPVEYVTVTATTTKVVTEICPLAKCHKISSVPVRPKPTEAPLKPTKLKTTQTVTNTATVHLKTDTPVSEAVSETVSKPVSEPVESNPVATESKPVEKPVETASTGSTQTIHLTKVVTIGSEVITVTSEPAKSGIPTAAPVTSPAVQLNSTVPQVPQAPSTFPAQANGAASKVVSAAAALVAMVALLI
ncbi:putative extracellular glycosidase [Yarrowia sp. B02]|nr:putative extracellular glycosidase [Yarrowia sp. B02]